MGSSLVGLGEAARSVWAKSLNKDGAWLPLWRHMDDSSDIAGGLFDRWLPRPVVDLLASPFGGDVTAARTAVTFLAGLHDLGKATPPFAVQSDQLAQRMREHGLYMPPTKAELVDRHKVHHSLAGHHLLRRWLVDRGWPERSVSAWAVVLGGHHGVPPDGVTLTEALPDEFPKLYGEGRWRDVQRELADRVAARTGADRYINTWRDVHLPATFQVLATGLVILSDWIASNESLFPYYSVELPEVIEEPERAGRALERLALPAPWAPAGRVDNLERLFATRFRLPPDAKPRPVQEAASRVAEQIPNPGLVIIEAPMGEGKTEAALAAAEIMARRWGSGGVHVALPTQATTDAMFGRVVEWLDALGASNQAVGAITLSHGKARLNRDFQGLVQGGRSVQIGCDEGCDSGPHMPRHAVVAHSWLSGRKKAQLANFVVGTIDQVLFAGLKARHLMLRHLALAGKIVVLDEVHAYDVFMNSYLTKVLTWLGAYGVPVVALSATLPPDRRQKLLNAYQTGQAVDNATMPVNPEDTEDDSYPVISWSEGMRVVSCAVPQSGRRTTVSVEALGGGANDDSDALVALLRDLLCDGGCALVVRNTVRRVLRTATALQAEFPGEVTVAHSRFIAADRLRKDRELLARFGPPGDGVTRPARHIVVASQVAEQSLDIDFDVLVSDLAPIDLVLQRMGRLHRHNRGADQCDRPAKLRSARAYIAGVDFSQAPPELETAAAQHIYGIYPLLRSAAVLLPKLGRTIELPDDIASLVRAAYGRETVEPASWQHAIEDAREKWLQQVDRRTAKARDFQIAAPPRAGRAILGWVSGSVGEADEDAQGQGQVRDGAPTLEAILVEENHSGEWATPTWLSAEQAALPVPRDHTPPDDLALVLASCSIRLPLEFSNADAEEELWAGTPETWEQSQFIYRLPVVVVDRNGNGVINRRGIRYTPDLGLEVLES
ncbi:CRISPR-associated helicase Cas3' [Mycobacterium botniense]|uniref:CRISPR-associated helicase/endonuclease Cas3 n=1 Tax=Mycobacterium botniense TaxID=84962 RepID=A0A7I9Y415_9MYCO|nr:CRISPR-associated helicase Cas3' [Mycobacterium botniense]GFG76633.1 CRISPR-associated helicase/endonuclease Cas3 [Mycobacterium botniense]